MTYNFSQTDVTPADVRDELVSRLGTLGVPNLVDSGLRGVSLDELTIGVERLLDPTLSIGLKASYREPAQQHRGPLRHRLQRPGEQQPHPSARWWIRAGTANTRAATSTTATAWTPATTAFSIRAIRIGLSMERRAAAPAKRIYKGVELVARKTLGDRLWLQASYVYSTLRGNYDGAVNEGLGGQTDPGHQSGLRLRDVPAELHRPPVPRPARRLSPCRLLSDAAAALGGFRCLRDLRRAARPVGILQCQLRRCASCREARPDACRRCGRRPDARVPVPRRARPR